MTPPKEARPGCSVCGKTPVRAKGMCAAHYAQHRRASQHAASEASSHLRVPTAGKKEGTPKGHRSHPKRKKVESTLGGLLGLFAGLTQPFLPPPFPLTDAECDLLVKTGTPVVLDDARLLRWVEKLDGVGGPKAQFGAAVLVVALPRAVHAKLISEEMARPVFNAALTIALADPDEFEEPTEPGAVDTGATMGERALDAAGV